MQNNAQFDQFAKATSICVNMAIDCVEADIRKELVVAKGDAVELLKRLLVKLRTRRLVDDLAKPSFRA